MKQDVLACSLGIVLMANWASVLAQTAAPAPPAAPQDSPEAIAKAAASDLKPSRYYNKPGATRAQYNEDWNECRLIASGYKTPGGFYPVYSPGVISPAMSGAIAGLAGGLLGAISQASAQRANHRHCLLQYGWRMVALPRSKAEEIAKMPEAAREAYFDTLIGAATVEGKITVGRSYLPDEPVFANSLAAVNPGPPTWSTGTPTSKSKTKVPADPKIPFILPDGMGAIVYAFSRPDKITAGNSVQINLRRYDPAKHELNFQPGDWKKLGDNKIYSAELKSVDRKAPYELQAKALTPGHYIVEFSASGPMVSAYTRNCLGAPIMTVSAGKTLYLGDWLPFLYIKMANGDETADEVGLSRNLENARKHLATFQPALAEKMELAEIRNGATYPCTVGAMSKFEIPGLPKLELPAPTPAVSGAPATASKP